MVANTKRLRQVITEGVREEGGLVSLMRVSSFFLKTLPSKQESMCGQRGKLASGSYRRAGLSAVRQEARVWSVSDWRLRVLPCDQVRFLFSCSRWAG